MNENQLLKVQSRSVSIAHIKIEHHKRLYRLTNHNKKKEKHKRNIRFQESVLDSMLVEHNWVNKIINQK